jgi:hypothetical protein
MDDVGQLEDKIEELKEVNPEIAYNVFKQQETVNDNIKPVQQQLDELAEVVVRMELMLKHIFGDHVLIDGNFRRINFSVTNVTSSPNSCSGDRSGIE